ncbi:hypothetical protein, partial [Bacillus velezensis]|uniref:hypothetical protein n=1 Tax=Bacillus velezensis TaxID=492670 RepID=UPI0020C09B2C
MHLIYLALVLHLLRFEYRYALFPLLHPLRFLCGNIALLLQVESPKALEGLNGTYRQILIASCHALI